MRSFRSKPVGWRNESYRHYLSAKGVKNKYFYPSDRQLVQFVAHGIKPFAEVDYSPEIEKFVKENDLKILEDEDMEGQPILIFGKTKPRAGFSYSGEEFGYPEDAIRAFNERDELLDSGVINAYDVSEDNINTYVRLIRAGVSANDLVYLEFIPLGMSPEAVRVEIEKRKSVTDEVPRFEGMVRAADVRAHRSDISPKDRQILKERLQRFKEEVVK